MRRALETVERIAGTDVPVLLTGEPGTGKTSIARRIHERSLRAQGPFITADLAALSDTLFERELFGHVRGAFTDAREDRPGRCDAAAGGTLFLDEIGTIGPRQQAALLRLLQSSEYEPLGSTTTRTLKARVIAATNADLEAAVRACGIGSMLFAYTFRHFGSAQRTFCRSRCRCSSRSQGDTVDRWRPCVTTRHKH
jgi:two-component system, NtrC family, response regulator HydG